MMWMLIWMVILAIGVLGLALVKVRRRRKTAAEPLASR